MKKLIALSSMIALTIAITVAAAHADDYYTRIDVVSNPNSINGFYEIDRMVIKKGDVTILDSEDDDGRDAPIDDSKGELSLKLNSSGNTLSATYKHQMQGNIFKSNPELAKYMYVYDKINMSVPSGKTALEQLTSAGISIYDKDDILWEIKLDDGHTMILVLEKEHDDTKDIVDRKYLLL